LGIIGDEEHKAEKIYRKELAKHAAVFFEGVKDVINVLSEKYSIILLSANYKKEIVERLEKENVLEYFVRIDGAEQALEVLKKEDKIKIILDELGVKKEEVLMIGDMDKDYHAAEKARIKSILVEYGWGYKRDNVPGYSLKTKVHKPMDILDAIEEVKKL
jgi:HAD superfamily hydrolase (TIGR01549 family)